MFNRLEFFCVQIWFLTTIICKIDKERNRSNYVRSVNDLLKSMTGYGNQIIQMEQYTISVEMRSVNNRFLDITLKMPRYLMYIEEQIKRQVKGYFTRGKLEIFITINGQGNIQKNLQVDFELLNQYMKSLNEMKSKYQLQGDIPVSTLVGLPEIFEVQEEEKRDEALKENILNAVEKSCQEMMIMRETEGTFLEKDILMRLEKLYDITARIEELRPQVIQEYQERITKRINAFLENVSEVDGSRITQEVAILAEKGDITEETVRLKSHIEHMRKTVKETNSVGRKLDFICQEMHREANTIGSKSTASELNRLDVMLKSEIEKIKEQVQNIE